MLAGEAPFRSKSLAQIIARKLATDTLDLAQEYSHVSQASVDLVRRMTERDPARRVGSYADLMARIDALKLAEVTAAPVARPSSAFATTQIIRSDPTPEQAAIRTIDLRPSQPKSTSRRGFLAVLTGGGLAAAVGVAAWRFWPVHGLKPIVEFVPAGLGLNLFDGLTLSGWQTKSGAWAVRRNDEGGRVLSGTSGRIMHPIYKQTGQEKVALTNFSVAAVIQLHGASAAEIEFGDDKLGFEFGDEQPRLVARLEKSSASLGRRAAATRPFIRTSDLTAFTSSGSEPHTLTVQHQPDYWLVLVDDQRVGTIPIAKGQRAAPRVTLVAEEGEAWFSDIILQELAPPVASSES
jgi:hypothetical protein